MSILQERQSLRALTAGEDEDRDAGRLARYAGRWASVIAGQAVPLGATLALVWLATVGLAVINYFVPFNLVSLIYMLPVVVAATQWGLGLGIVAAIAGAAAADFFFYPPLYTFWIRDPQNVSDLILFLLIALVTSNLAARLKNEAVAVQRREKEIMELHAFSQGLATCLTSRDLIFAVQDYLSNTLRYRAVLIATDYDVHAHAGVPEDVRRRAGELMAGNALAASTVVDTHRGRAVSSRSAENSVVLSVMDQGSGLTVDEKGQVGRRPFRGRRIGPGGSGLGLWIASTFVAANGGSLHAESRGPGLGTTMSMRLPTVSAETPELLDVVDG